ncbi:chemotaxis protein CheX [Puniceicoccaceae bacterium K14]|nr:chemotaxis protein CheX [Puniceicoccaceae bacterium K14]
MQQTFPINDKDLEALANNALTTVFDTMLDTKVSLNESIILESESYNKGLVLPLDTTQPLVTGTVGFIGKLTGIIYIFMNLPFAEKLTCKLLDMEPDDLDSESTETVNDALGELTNMIVGTFKNELSDKGFHCRMTIPSILRGSNYTIEPVEVALRRIYQFECEGSPFVIDILMKEED